MIEKKSAVEHLDEILAVPGVDMLQFGPVTIHQHRKPGQARHPTSKTPKLKWLKKSAEKGIAPRVEATTWKSQGNSSKWACAISVSEQIWELSVNGAGRQANGGIASLLKRCNDSR